MRRARAKALKTASALWWSLSPWAEIWRLHRAAHANEWKKWRNISVGTSPTRSRRNEASHSKSMRPPKSSSAERPAVVHRQGEAVAGYPGLRAQRAVDGLAQRDGHVLHRVVFVDVQIAPRVDGQRDAAVVGDLREHVVQKAQARGDLAVEIPAAVEVEADGDLRLAGLAPDFGPAFAAADEFGDFAPRVGDQRTGVGGAGFLQRPQPFGGGSEQDAPRPEVAGQQDVGRAVADDVARREVVFGRPCSGRTSLSGVCAWGRRRPRTCGRSAGRRTRRPRRRASRAFCYAPAKRYPRGRTGCRARPGWWPARSRTRGP